MIKISDITNSAAEIIAKEGVKLYKTVCPQDFTRPSRFISAVNQNIQLGREMLMTVNVNIIVTSFLKMDNRGNADAQELTDAATEVTDSFLSNGGIMVGDNFLDITAVKNEFGMDAVNTTITVSYMDAPDVVEDERDMIESVQMEVCE